MVDKIIEISLFAWVLVLLLWIAQWLFMRFPRLSLSFAALKPAFSRKTKKADKTV